MKTTSTAKVLQPVRRSSAVAGTGVQPADVSVDPPERLPQPSSEEFKPGQFERSVMLWIIVIAMAATSVAAAFLATL